jgi:hypothetical protein
LFIATVPNPREIRFPTTAGLIYCQIEKSSIPTEVTSFFCSDNSISIFVQQKCQSATPLFGSVFSFIFSFSVSHISFRIRWETMCPIMFWFTFGLFPIQQ